MSSSRDTSNRYTVAIIGAGGIGSMLDGPDSPHVLTHAHAFSSSPKTRLVGLVDIDAARGTSEAARWNTAFFPDVEALMRAGAPDILVIATPDSTHAEMMEVSLRSPAKLVVFEKPVARTAQDAERVRAALSGSSIPVIVNFPRRFDPVTQHLRDELLAGTHGTVISAHAAYAKGTHHIGSHVFDLLRTLFGEMKVAEARFKIEDYPDDPTYGGAAVFERCPEVHLQAMDGRITSLIELEILTDTKRIRLTDRGYVLEMQPYIPDPVFENHRTLGPVQRSQTELQHAMSALAAHAAAVLDGTEAPRATAEDALKTFEACDAFARSYHQL